ncbi:hypothetical protein C8F01DRAFT_1204368, partial [Mycena amicta]
AKYVRTIVSDIDDAAFATEEDNKALDAVGAEKKETLRTAKQALAEARDQYRALVPSVEADYTRLKDTAGKAAELTQKIIDARLALTRLRHAHPKPHLTISGAEQRLADQVTEMQVLSDEISEAKKRVAGTKGSLKNNTQEVEKLRAERAGRGEGNNDLQLNYTIERRPISILLRFHPNTRQLANVNVSGLEEQGVDVTEVGRRKLIRTRTTCGGLMRGFLSMARGTRTK